MSEIKTAWAVKLPDGERFQVQDLPPEIVDDIAKVSNVTWRVVIDAPGADLGTGLAILRAVDLVTDGPGFVAPATTRAAIRLLADSFEMCVLNDDGTIAGPAPTLTE